jgi:CTP:molybdopterin cytidylyltransferase MocA
MNCRPRCESDAEVNVAGLILGAGESRRMGSPKALLQYRGETFLDTLIGLFAGPCRTVTVVLGAGAGDIRARVGRPATFVVNPGWALGQTTSMQCGLRAVPADAEGVLFTLVDHPAVSPATIHALLDGKRPLIRVPRFDNRRGHPIWFSRELIPEFLALPETGAARDVVRIHAAETEFLDVDDPGILADIDDAEAYRRLTGAGL